MRNKRTIIKITALLLSVFLSSCSLLPNAANTSRRKRSSSSDETISQSSGATSTPNSNHRHSFTTWENVIEPTCTEYGTKKRTCRVCGYEERASVNKVPHTFGEPYEETFGEIIYSCQVCGTTENAGNDYCSLWIEDLNGIVVSKTIVERGQPLPFIDPPEEIPNGYTFYGYRNINNGGQMWDFSNENNKVIDDVFLRPVILSSSLEEYSFEAELVPDITEANGGQGMRGATYSGGMTGQGLIYIDRHYKLGSSGRYIRNNNGKARYATGSDNPEDIFGAMVHYLYYPDSYLLWEIYSSEEVNNVSLFARFSTEYGMEDLKAKCYTSSFDEETVEIKVAGDVVHYGRINMFTDENLQLMPCQEYLLATDLHLFAGFNEVRINIHSGNPALPQLLTTAPIVDCVRLVSSRESNLEWPDAKLANLDDIR